jgi:hypothetical protein
MRSRWVTRFHPVWAWGEKKVSVAVPLPFTSMPPGTVVPRVGLSKRKPP